MTTRGISRRTFLAVLAAGATAVACEPYWRGRPGRDEVGVALGGGGAKGLAHILMLEALDETGVRPCRMAGTSIGAVMGMLYAAGLSGRDIRALFEEVVITEWLGFLDPDLGRGGLVDTGDFMAFVQGEIQQTSFDELEIPLEVVAADLWARKQVVFEEGPLLPAVKASMALPGLFTPVRHAGRVLVDGGLVNPVPYDLLVDECAVTVAIDVHGTSLSAEDGMPSYWETTFNSVQIMQEAILSEKLKRLPPTIYIRPELRGIRVLEFYRSEEIYRQAAPAKEELKRRLDQALTPRKATT